VGTAFANERNALVYLRFVVDQRMLYIRSAYDSEKCINEVYDEVANKYVSIETINTTLPPDFQIPAV
jgi:hypothetical protein